MTTSATGQGRLSGVKTFILALTLAASALHAADPIPNPLIDYSSFLKIAKETELLRAERRLTQEQFATMAAEKDTIILDARSADKYAMRHIRGAVSLPFTDFSEESLAKAILTKDTRILIYCNNNFLGDQFALVSKRPPASLNISTFIALRTYGYNNVYELGPLLDIAKTNLPFEGTRLQSDKTPEILSR